MAAENNNEAYSISHADESHAQERVLSPQITVPPHAVNLQWAGLSLSLFCCNYTVTLLINHQFCKAIASPTWSRIHRKLKKLRLKKDTCAASSRCSHCVHLAYKVSVTKPESKNNFTCRNIERSATLIITWMLKRIQSAFLWLRFNEGVGQQQNPS